MVMVVCYMQGHKLKNGFIASQGPILDDIPDFWRMIWEQNTTTIVMIANILEGGRVEY